MPGPTSFYEKILNDTGGAEPPEPRVSVSIVPWRRTDSGEIEVYWVRRAKTMRFMGGWHAFPGGGLSRRDAGIEIFGSPRGRQGQEMTAHHVTDPLPGLDDSRRAKLSADLIPGLLACGLRELFEETGLLLTTSPDDLDGETLAPARRRLLEKEIDFPSLVAAEGWDLDARELVFAGRWMTPPLAPLRFDNRFFLLEWPASRPRQPEILEGELDHGEWIRPHRALERWRSSEIIAAPPILHILRVLAEEGPDNALPRLHDPAEANLGTLRRVEFRPGVLLLPLCTTTLPPATHTNTYVLGTDESVLVDPAPTEPREIERLGEAIDVLRQRGRRFRAIWLTHHHPDHVGAVRAMATRLGVPVEAHAETAERLSARGLDVAGTLEDAQEVVLDGSPPFAVRIFHTPGHARGHLCFFDEGHRSLIAGDLVSGLSTIVIDPPEGDMDDYLDSLERMADLSPETVFPSHGPIMIDGEARLRQVREHRLWREKKIARAFAAGRQTAGQMVAEVYDDVPPAMHPIAERQIEAHLIRLRRQGALGSR